MTIAVELYSGGNWKNHFAMLGWVVPLADTFLQMIMEFPHAIQMTSQAVVKGFPKQRFFGNQHDNTQQKGEHSCFCNTTWA